MLQLDGQSFVLLATGKSRSGKTTFIVRWLIAALKLRCRFIFDPEGEYSQRLGIPAAETVQELRFAIEDGWALFNPHPMFPGNMPGAFAFFCQFAFDASSRIGGRNVIVIDEAWKYCSPQSIPAPFALCLQTGGKRGLGVALATQRPNRLNESITNEVTELVCFRLKGENAIRSVASIWDLDAAEIRNLPLGSFIAIDDNTGGEMRGKIF